MIKDIAIIGAGGLGREVLGLIKSINSVKQTWNVIGFFDDGSKEISVNGISVIGGFKELNEYHTELSVVLAIGNPLTKRKIFKKISNPNVCFPNIIHPSVIVYEPEYVNFGRGVVVGANSVITTNVRINDFVYINIGVIISHDALVKEFTMIMSSVCISAGAIIGEAVYLGNGVRIDKPIIIADEKVIPMGVTLSA